MIIGKLIPLNMLYLDFYEEWQNELDMSGFVETILKDLFKAYDCLPHDLLIAKSDCIGKLELNLKLLINQNNRAKANSWYCDWYDIIRSVPKEFILYTWLFNLFINDLFLFLERINI